MMQLAALAGPPVPDAETRRRKFLERLSLDGSARPAEMRDLRLGIELLCWYLAKRCSRRTREAFFVQLDAVQLDGWLEDRMWGVCRERMESRIDIYLASPTFDPATREPELPEPSTLPVRLPEVTNWRPLVVTPLARLVFDHRHDSNELYLSMEDALEGAALRQSSALRPFLADGAWRTVLAYLANSPRDEALRRFNACQQTLVEAMAALVGATARSSFANSNGSPLKPPEEPG